MQDQVSQLLVEVQDIEWLAARIEAAADDGLERMSHYVTEPAAAALAETRPGLAAWLIRTLAVRILDAKKSKCYPAALRHLERTRDCCAAAGEDYRWEQLVGELRAAHRCKTSFIPGFERVVGGETARERRPSSLERAKNRWPR